MTAEVGPSPLSKNDDLLNKSFDDLKSGEMVGQRAVVQDANSSVRVKPTFFDFFYIKIIDEEVSRCENS